MQSRVVVTEVLSLAGVGPNMGNAATDTAKHQKQQLMWQQHLRAYSVLSQQYQQATATGTAAASSTALKRTAQQAGMCSAVRYFPAALPNGMLVMVPGMVMPHSGHQQKQRQQLEQLPSKQLQLQLQRQLLEACNLHKLRVPSPNAAAGTSTKAAASAGAAAGYHLCRQQQQQQQ
ncbi:hypothetical protein COO60DRAFT_53886 [Scenedesmus sp. NREL 46B-D3]|nr:hypothetical protein COO60DRAFT_53886 [Scenedesmus sp. NREL 46B-D3]